MQYLYHSIPDPMVGTELVPLNRIRDSQPDLYALHRAKYKGREEVMERKIPLLNCLWNDAVQFLPLHPHKVFELQVKLGLIPHIPPYKFFEIDPNQFELERAVVYFKSAPGEENMEVKWLKDVDLAALQEIPATTVEYYKSLIGTGELPFNYQFIPHVLYMGTVDISNARIISL